MNSKIPDDFLSAFYDRELSAAEEPAVKWHVQASPQARQELHDHERISQLLQELPQQTLPTEFAAAVMQQAERESLIPIDAMAIVECNRHLELPSRRLWIFAGAGTAAIAVLFLLFVNVSSEKNAQPVVARNDMLALKREPTAAKEPLSEVKRAVEKLTTVRSLSGAGLPTLMAKGTMPVAPPTVAAVPKQLKTARAKSSVTEPTQLVFPADLKTAQVGEIIEALEKSDEEVAIVRLTVVNQAESIEGIQSLLVRGNRRTVDDQHEARRLKEQFQQQKKAGVLIHAQATPRAPGDLVCVFVEGTRDQLATVLQDVQQESNIKKAQLTKTISAAKLAQFTQGASSRSEDSGNLPQKRPQQVVQVKVPASAAYEILGVDPLSRKLDLGGRAASRFSAPKRELSRVASRDQRSFQVFFVIDDPSVERQPAVAPRPARTDVPNSARKSE